MPGVLTKQFESLLDDETPAEMRESAWSDLLKDDPPPAFDPGELSSVDVSTLARPYGLKQPMTPPSGVNMEPRGLEFLKPIEESINRMGRESWNRSTLGLAASIAKGEIPETPDLPWYEDIGATVGSFVIDPLTYLTFNVAGGFVTREVAKQMLKKGAAKGAAALVGGVAGAGVGLGGYSAGQYPVRQAAFQQPYSLGEHVSETVKMGTIGAASAGAGRAVAGPAGNVARRAAGLGAEIGTFGTLIPVAEGRVPEAKDYGHAAGVILGIKATHAVGRGLWKLGRGIVPTGKEAEALKGIEPTERARIALIAKGLKDGSLRINAETDALEPVTAEAVATLYKTQLLTPGGAAALLSAAPDAARAIGGETKPSRRGEFKKLRDLAPKAETEKWSAEERKRMAELVREQEAIDAREVRGDTGQVGEARPIVERGQAPSREDIQRRQEAQRPEAAPQEARVGKQPWEMTNEEAVGSRPAAPEGSAEHTRWGQASVLHRDAVERALREGKPVPAEVLKDYPELEAPLAPAPREEEVGVARPIGRPELANPALTPEGRRLVDTVDEARKQAGIPAKVTFEEMEAQAAQRLQADYAAERGRLLEFARKGGTIPAEHLDGVVARQIIRREELETIKTGDPQRLKELGMLIEAYRGLGTEYARDLAIRRDAVKSPEERRQQIIVEAIVRPRQKDIKKLEKAKRKGDPQAAERIRDKTAKEHQQLRKDLQKLGIKLEDIEQYLRDEHKVAAILRAAQTLKGDKWDALYEWWNNSILGALTTQAANIIGNTGHMGWYFTGQRLTDALVNTIGRNPKEAQWGEFPYMMAATLPGMSRAARNFWRSFDTELPVLERDFGKPGVTRFEVARVTIRGTKGRIIRLPWRTLLAFDQLQKSLTSEVETAALAYRRSKAAGLTGRELQLDIAQQVMDPASEARSESIDTANRLAFMSPSEVSDALIKFRGKVPLVRYQIPFVMTPWNIMKRGFRISPAGTIPLSWKIYQGMKTGTWDGVTPRIAEQMIAWSVFLALLSNDPDDPFITGAVEEYKRGPREQARRTYPPQSIRLPDGSWWSYARIEPFATALALMVDFTNAFRSGDVKRIATVPITSVVGQVKNKTFMQGLGDFFRTFESPDVSAAMARWSSSFLVSWVPNIVRSAGRSTRDVYPERAVWGKGTDWLERLGKRTLQRTELGILAQEPGIDLWGREQVAPKSPVPQTDWLWRMSMPIRIKQEDITKGDAVLLKWNVQHPDEPKYPGEARPTYTVDGKRKYMTDEQYTQFLRMSGRLANEMVEVGNFDVEEPDKDDIDRVLGVISKARSVVKKGLVKEWSGGREFSYERLSPFKLYRDYVKARRRRKRR